MTTTPAARGEQTLRENLIAWRRCAFRPRVLRDVSAVDTGVRLPDGTGLATPVAVAPTGFQRLAHPAGEVAAAAAADR